MKQNKARVAIFLICLDDGVLHGRLSSASLGMSNESTVLLLRILLYRHVPINRCHAIKFRLSTYSLFIVPSGCTNRVVVPMTQTKTKIQRKQRSMTMATNFQSCSLEL